MPIDLSCLTVITLSFLFFLPISPTYKCFVLYFHPLISFLTGRPYNDVRFVRVEENPSVWISFETTVSALTNLVTIEKSQMEKLGDRGDATRALWMWSLAVCSQILQQQDGQKIDPRTELTKDEIWGRAWAFGMLNNMQDVQRHYQNKDNLEYYKAGGM